MSPTPHARAPRSASAPRTGAVLGRLLAGVVAIVGIAALVGLVAVQNGWLMIQRGGTTPAAPAALASAGDVTVPTAVGAPPPTDADSANAGTGMGAPGLVPPGTAPTGSAAASGSGDSVGLPVLDPAYGDSGRAPGAAGTGATPAGDSLAGLGERTPGARTAPTVTATPAELSALRTRMTVPVRGVAPSALRDDFEQARGGGSRRHQALDIMAPRGTPVVAATDGRIVKLFDSREGGLTVYQSDASDRFVLLYGHLDRYEPGLREGATVRRGQVVGYVGSSGNADPGGPHLHFAVARSADPARWWGSGTPVNPYPLLRP